MRDWKKEFKCLLGWCWPGLFTFAVLVLLAVLTGPRR